MRLIYSFLIICYGLFLRFASLFNLKARQWTEGRRGLFRDLEAALKQVDRKKSPIAWFHVSSLGEFEQGRPVMEAFRKRWPEKQILLTFFSPSGYLVRKNYEQALYVCYLPLDLSSNARKFLDIVQPEMVFFIKYDFWFNYLNAIDGRKIPIYFISALFREKQYFFKWYGRWFRHHLAHVTRFFVQNRSSEELLQSVGISQATLTGDTRFDRVHAIASQYVSMPLIEKFCAGHQVFIAGSSWEPDEILCFALIQRNELNLKYIFAPHDTSPERIRFIREHIGRQAVCYSELNEGNAGSAEVLIIDSVGLLSQLYRYAAIALIGGGFGNGIHNIQEPVTFGVPVMFGPNYHKFREAADLVRLGGAFTIASAEELLQKVRNIAGNSQEYSRLSDICRNYVDANRGATEKIIAFLEQAEQ